MMIGEISRGGARQEDRDVRTRWVDRLEGGRRLVDRTGRFSVSGGTMVTTFRTMGRGTKDCKTSRRAVGRFRRRLGGGLCGL